jgi:hypothetical protein
MHDDDEEDFEYSVRLEDLDEHYAAIRKTLIVAS